MSTEIKNKMPISFAAAAAQEAQNSVISIYEGTTAVHATKQITVFQHHGALIAMPGNLHEKIDAPFCIEFDVIYNNGNAVIRNQRLYNE